jgi:hypothetical protein
MSCHAEAAITPPLLKLIAEYYAIDILLTLTLARPLSRHTLSFIDIIAD